MGNRSKWHWTLRRASLTSGDSENTAWEKANSVHYVQRNVCYKELPVGLLQSCDLNEPNKERHIRAKKGNTFSRGNTFQ